MADTQNQPLPENTNQRVSLDELLSAPIRDIVKAQNALAVEQVKFLLENCFKKVGDTYEPITIDITMNADAIPPHGQEGNSKIEGDKTTMNLPLLTVMPFNSLNVDNVTLNFDLDIAMIDMPSLQGNAPQFMVKTIATREGNVEANITAQQDSASNRLKLTVELGQLPLSNDAGAIIAAFTRSVSPIK